jgi:hypothetical protein
MASNNQLLGSGKPEVVVEAPLASQEKTPAWRFHITCPEGILVKTDKQLDELDKADWKDHPGKVRLLPGHEKIWETEQAKEAFNNEGKGLAEDMMPETESIFDHSDSKQTEKTKSLFEE